MHKTREVCLCYLLLNRPTRPSPSAEAFVVFALCSICPCRPIFQPLTTSGSSVLQGSATFICLQSATVLRIEFWDTVAYVQPELSWEFSHPILRMVFKPRQPSHMFVLSLNSLRSKQFGSLGCDNRWISDVTHCFPEAASLDVAITDNDESVHYIHSWVGRGGIRL